jgi:hypothetical protein
MRRSSIIAGIILIGVGLFFLVLPAFPNLSSVIDISQQWPLIIVAIGFIFLLGALVGTPELAIPASIIMGTGAILYYQNLSGNWWTWSFIWALYPGFVGIGIIISEALQGRGRSGLRTGSRLIVISVILFLVFGFFFGAGMASGVMLALLLIALGVWVIIRTFVDSGGRKEEQF